MINKFFGKYRFLSNFYVEPDGTFVEREFQTGKATCEKDMLYVASSVNAKEAKRRGRSIELRKDWDDVKADLMSRLVEQKFRDHPDLARRLLDTGDVWLEEGNTWGDRFWGTVNGVGENWLGVILMTVRAKLQAEAVNNEC